MVAVLCPDQKMPNFACFYQESAKKAPENCCFFDTVQTGRNLNFLFRVAIAIDRESEGCVLEPWHKHILLIFDPNLQQISNLNIFPNWMKNCL